MDRVQRVRERAYQIWQAEGCPPDCEQEHWARAEQEIADELTSAPHGADVGPPPLGQAEAKDKADVPGKTSAAADGTPPKRTKRNAAAATKAPSTKTPATKAPATKSPARRKSTKTAT